MISPKRSKPFNIEYMQDINTENPELENFPFVFPQFLQWARSVNYTLEGIPTAPNLDPMSEDVGVHYRILRNDPDATDGSKYAAEHGHINVYDFVQALAMGKGYIGGVALADIVCLHIQMPDSEKVGLDGLVVDSVRSFPGLRSFIYCGDPQDLEQRLGISWAISFPSLQQLKILGNTAPSTFRSVIQGSRKLEWLSVNALSEDGTGDNHSQDSPQAEEDGEGESSLKYLRVVSDIGVEKAFRGLTLEKLSELRLWMMPSVAMGLRPEHLRMNSPRSQLYLNYKLDSDSVQAVMGITNFDAIQ